MAVNHLGLGKGLDALIRETSGVRQAESVQTVPLRDITPNPNQPRRRFAEKALEELAASIRSQGLLQPILVRPLGEAYPGKYEIVAGERRWRASKLAGLTEVPVVVRNFSDLETLAAALVENLQREDLNPLEEARGIQVLKEEFGLSQDDLAQRLGKSRSAVANSLRLLSLPESFHKDLAEGRLSAGHARALLSITSERAQGYLRNLILEESLSVREAEGLAATWKETGRFQPETTMFIPGKSAATESGTATAEQGSTGPANQPDRGNDADGADKELNCAAREDAALGSADARRVRQSKDKPQSAKLLEVQARVSSVFSVPVRVTGKESKGKISLTYSSRKELDTILNKLALAAGEGAATAMLTADTRPELAASGAAALGHSENAALSGQQALALGASSTNAMLKASSSAPDSVEITKDAAQGDMQAAPPAGEKQ